MMGWVLSSRKGTCALLVISPASVYPEAVAFWNIFQNMTGWEHSRGVVKWRGKCIAYCHGR